MTTRLTPSASLLIVLGLAVSTTLVGGCATSVTTPTAETGPTADTELLESLHWSRNSAEHRAIFEQTFALATERIERLAENHDPGTWAVSVDADETLIDNSMYEVELSRRSEVFGQESWSAWVQRRAAPALPGAAAFTTRVREFGGLVAVVTNRRTYNCAATADNLRQVGITFDVVLCRADDREKESRWDALSAGNADAWPDVQKNTSDPLAALTVLLWVGDNIGDFPLLTQEIRTRDDSLIEFGNRFFAVPNPMYGSWEENPMQ